MKQPNAGFGLALIHLILAAIGLGGCVETPSPTASTSLAPAITQLALDGDADNPIALATLATAQATLSTGESRHYQLTVPASHDGLRVAVSCPAQCDLFVRRESTTGGAVSSDYNDTLHTAFFEPGDTAADDQWYIEVKADGAGDIALRADPRYAIPLTWDPGTALLGSARVDAPDTVGGDYLFAITSRTTALAAWRWLVDVSAGEADLYVTRDGIPSDGVTYRSTRVGSDGVAMPANAFQPNETWYARVHAQPGATWAIASGDIFVTDLGALRDDDTGDANVTVGLEGVAWVSAEVPAATLAWRLAVDVADAQLYIDESGAPIPGRSQTWDQQGGQHLLVVPEILKNTQFLAAIEAPVGTVVAVNSRRHLVLDPQAEVGFNGADAFSFTLPGTIDPAFPYVTYRVEVPVDQIAWQTQVEAQGGGNVDVYVRRGSVPNVGDNDGLSEAPAPTVDSVTQVPPTLTNGTWYVTVTGDPGTTFTLQSGNPAITDVTFVNDPVPVDNGAEFHDLVGWRYFRVGDIDDQVGALGWILELEDAPPGTEIALRRNAVPGRRSYRTDQRTHTNQAGQVDYSGTQGFLERANHPADIWYIGVYHPTVALGPFKLRTRRVAPETVALNGGAVDVSAQVAGRWRWFKVIVDADTLGWDVRLTNVTSGQPKMVIRRDLLPDSFSSTYLLYRRTAWQSGDQQAAGSDLTGRPYGFWDGTGPQPAYIQGHRAFFGMGAPMSPGTYYVGINDLNQNPAGPLSYRFESRGVGEGTPAAGGTWSNQVQTLAYDGGDVTITGQAPREVAYFKVEVPEGAESWSATLTPTLGDAMMVMGRGFFPNEYASNSGSSAQPPGLQRIAAGTDRYYRYPDYNQDTLSADTYYIAVGAEGQDAYSSSYIGTGPTNYTLTSDGPVEVAGGAATMLATDTPLAWTGETLPWGAQTAYRFTVPEGIASMEIRLDTAAGNPYFTTARLEDGPFPSPSQSYYAAEGGTNSVASDDSLVTVTNPGGTYTILVTAQSVGGLHPDATYDLRVIARGENILAFNGGSATVTEQETQTWQFFRVDVPTDATGWDIRLANVVAGKPQMVIRRTELPQAFNSTYLIGRQQMWAEGNQWAASSDITGRPYTPYYQLPDGSWVGGVYQVGRIHTMGMNAPLSPGSYIVGVSDLYSSQSGDPMSYELVSRGIGEGNDASGTPWAFQITPLAFDGGIAQVTDLEPRDLAWFRVEVPEGAASWSMSLTPTEGEAMFAISEGALPNVESSPSYTTQDVRGTRRQKDGAEYFYRYPDYNADALEAGTYYIAVGSEGVDPYSSSYIGQGPSSATIASHGEIDVLDAPAPVTPETPARWDAETLPYGAQKSYRFTVPPDTVGITVRLENTEGHPYLAVSHNGETSSDAPFPSPTQSYRAAEGGGASVATTDTIATIAEPDGTYTIVVAAYQVSSGDHSDAVYDLVVTPQSDDTLAFNGGSLAVVDHEPETWRYFRVTVPEDAIGWDLRLEDVSSEHVRMVVRRDDLPEALNDTYLLYRRDRWQPGEQMQGPGYLDGRVYSPYDPEGPSSVYQPGRALIVGMNAPLSPGDYVIGVTDQSNQSIEPYAYTVRSRGIGVGNDGGGVPWAIQVADLPFADGEAAIEDLAPHDVSWFRVTVPEGADSLALSLEPTDGEAMMLVGQGALPNRSAANSHNTDNWPPGTRRQKGGSEYFYRYPANTERTLAPAQFYVAVVSEGRDPYSSSYIGTGTIDATLRAHGEAPLAGTTEDVVRPGTTVRFEDQQLAYGAQHRYRFRVSEAVEAFEVRLADRVGNPALDVGVYPFFEASTPYSSQSYPYYGSEGGTSSNQVSGEVAATVAGRPGDVTVVVTARQESNVDTDAQFDLVITPTPVPTLAFDGGAVTVETSDAETRYFRVDIPQDCDGVAAAGWVIGLDRAAGEATMKVRKDYLPGAPGNTNELSSGSAETIVSPPRYEPGTWYIAVTSTTIAEYTVTSRPVAERRQWVMPARGETAARPGLTHPVFGDSGVLASGDPVVNPTTGGQGVDLGHGRHHFYRVTVPPGNAGLLAHRLEAISGDPELYIRRGASPTLAHGQSNTFGQLYDWYDTRDGSSYGYWVPYDKRSGDELAPGEYWLAVYAPQSNVRYRLAVSLGRITDVAQSGGAVTGQQLAAGDMRFYRIRTAASGAAGTTEWHLDLLQQQGDVEIFLREDVPPGFTRNVPAPTSPQNNLSDWQIDRSLYGYDQTFSRTIDDQGRTTFVAPPVAPNTDYYLGVFGKTDAIFDLASSTGGPPIDLAGTLDFADGLATGTLAPGASRLYRVDVPADAARWRSTTTSAADVWFMLHVDAPPPPRENGGSDWTNNGRGPSVEYDRGLYAGSSGQLYAWPFRPGRSVFLRVENTSATDQAFSFQMDGRDRADDSDTDNLPDWWEYRWFGGLYYNADADYDNDQLTNLEEYTRDTIPTDADSDDDSLSDGLEVAIGANPLVGDSDSDLACDGEDSAPTDPNEAGPIIRLRMGQMEGGEYGNGYGTSEHTTRLVAVFERTNSEKAHWIHLTGWGIDSADEVAVYLNGVQLTSLTPSTLPDGTAIPGMWWIDTADLVSVGDNRLELVQTTPGETWGVRQLGLFALGQRFGADPTEAYDQAHPDGFDVFWDGSDSQQLFEIQGWDLDAVAEVTMHLNGAPFLPLPADGDAAWSPYWQVPIDPADLAETTAGPNVLSVRPAGDTDGAWQWRLVDCRPLQSWFGTQWSYVTVEDGHADDGVDYLMPAAAAGRRLAVQYRTSTAAGSLTVSGSAQGVADTPSLPPTTTQSPSYEYCSPALQTDTVRIAWQPDPEDVNSRYRLQAFEYLDADPNDADCDGIVATMDCDDNDPAIGTSDGDADCDEVPTDVDCDDTDPEITTTNTGDADCDGIPTAADCDDADPDSTAIADDADCDGLLTAEDCDDSDAGNTSSRVGDADCDGVATAVDCDDSDPLVGSGAGDTDCDEVPAGIDCDDSDPQVTTTNVNDTDCDGVSTADDCDDTDATIVTTTAGDGDCDGVPTETDCDDADAALTATNVNDVDCDGTPTPMDCDDTTDTDARSNLHDADCDDVSTELDCDDHDPLNQTTRLEDADCDGVPGSVDCNDLDPLVVTTSTVDADCDGVETADDCDDTDPTRRTRRSEDADCDGVPTIYDCDDSDAGQTGSTASDADCDGVPTGLDCNDADAENRRSRATDRDCDGVLGAVDCDDEDPAETGQCGGCVDADEDGHPARSETCDLGADCDDDDPDSTWLDVDQDCDGVVTDADCDDANPDRLARADDADCDGVPTGVDCDDSDASDVTECGERCEDKDEDGVFAVSAFCPAGDDCDDGDAASTKRSEDADCDGVRTADDCDDSDVEAGSRAGDADCDGFPDTIDRCPDDPLATQDDADGDGVGDACDVCPTVMDGAQTDSDGDGVGDACEDADGDGIADIVDSCPEVANPDQLDLDHDGIGDACDPEVGVVSDETGGCSGGWTTVAPLLLWLMLALGGLLVIRRRRHV